ncbi:sulfatase-like hydrolase/transferase [Rhodopirellula sp.]|nr:sulfatase-like hydrolase/transferase [Rhodopirellula sp.]
MAILLLLFVCFFTTLIFSTSGSSNAFAEPPLGSPNILLILADDMGYGDLGCMGSEHLQTPHLDQLAASGVLCKQAYVASAVCSPSRAGLITGRDPRRFGYEGNLNEEANHYATRPELLGLPPGEHTLADHLRNAGYRTSLIGKWHLGMSDRFHPQNRGFDYFCGMLGGGHGYFPDPDNNRLQRNGEPLREFSSPYLTDFFTDEAVDWIKESTSSTAKPTPWFLYLSYNAPHGPRQARPEDEAIFESIQDPKRRTYAAMVYAMDRGIGRVLSLLEETGQRDNTLICFFSDNGGATNNGSWNGPLSGVKGCLKEGGIRVPMIWSWPANIPVQPEQNGVVSSLDLLPTFLAAAKANPLPLAPPRSHEDQNNRKKIVRKYGEYDGVNLLPLLQGTAEPQRRTLFWRLQGQAAILDGKDKLIHLSHRPAELFDPTADVAESNNRMNDDPTRAAELYQMLGGWQSLLPTVPLWGSSPYWSSQSAQHYDKWQPSVEPN